MIIMRVKQQCILCGLGILTLTLLLAQTFGPGRSRAADDPTKPAWRVFRGNAEQTGAAAVPLPDKLEVLWKFATKDSIEGAAAIVGGVVYVG
ncbi:MAG: PQQ-binding-like beta-propeller repeat protein, partial [Gemmataceae bacterium]